MRGEGQDPPYHYKLQFCRKYLARGTALNTLTI